ncbi:E3 ubiquitin-protein ligase RNF4-like isoform X2 [Lineus longissimus]
MYRRGGRTPLGNVRRPATRRRPRPSHPPAPAAPHGDSGSIIIIDDDDDDRTTIDLTSDDTPQRKTYRNNGVIDLTSPNSHLPVVIGQPTPSRRSPRNRRNVARIISSDSDSDELPDLNHSYNRSDSRAGSPDLSLVTPAEKPKVGDAASRSTRSRPEESPFDQMAICPICFDNYQAIRASHRKVYSTVCGHIFCNECIKVAIRSQHRCPTCRKKLTLSQTHPVFLGF